jgi:hypothetical protein
MLHAISLPSKELWDRLYWALDEAELEARKTHGDRPESRIKWRDRDTENQEGLVYCREKFLSEPDADPKQVEKEYMDAKARLAAAECAGAEWDQRANIAPLREQYERGKLAEDRAKKHLARTKPTTPAGAGALVAYIQRDLEDVALEGWHSAALKTVAASLARMNREAA